MFRRLMMVCGMVALCSQPRVAEAQTGGAQRAELGARFDSIWPLLVAAESTYKQLSIAANNAEAAKKTETLDSVMVGPLTVVARPGVIDEARDYITAIWQNIEPSVRGSEAKLAGVTLLIETAKPVAMFRPMSQRPRHRLLQIPTLLAPSVRQAYGMRAVGLELTSAMPHALRSWLVGAPLSWERGYSSIYRELAVGRSHAAASCFRFDAGACEASLAFEPPDSMWSQWYSKPQLRELAIETARFRNVLRSPLMIACARQNHFESCAEFLRTGDVGAPLSPGARAAFLVYALQQGGDGSFTRLLSSSGDVRQAIEAAAGQPIGKLVTAWRADIQNARPQNAGMTKSRLAAVVWLLICVGLAMRSTRWRLG